MDIYKNCRVLQLSEDLRLKIYGETIRMKSIEHYSSGAGNKLRNHVNKMIDNIKDGWILPAGAKKADYFGKALKHSDEIEKFINISETFDKVKNAWEEPRSVLTAEITPKLEALFNKARKLNKI